MNIWLLVISQSLPCVILATCALQKKSTFSRSMCGHEVKPTLAIPETGFSAFSHISRKICFKARDVIFKFWLVNYLKFYLWRCLFLFSFFPFNFIARLVNVAHLRLHPVEQLYLALWLQILIPALNRCLIQGDYLVFNSCSVPNTLIKKNLLYTHTW